MVKPDRIVVWMGAGYYRPRVYSAIALVLWTWTPDEPAVGTWVDNVQSAGRIGRVIGEGA